MKIIISLLLFLTLFLASCSDSIPTATEVDVVADVGGCPDGVTTSEAGKIYITDICDGSVKRINDDGTATVIVAPGLIEAPDGVTAVTTDEGKEILYVTETGTDPITGEIISSDGSVKKIDVDTGVVTEFVDNSVISNPTGIAADSSGNLYIADQSGSVYKVPVDGSGNAKAPVDLTADLPSDVTIEAPHGITLVEDEDSNVTLYVTDQGTANNSIIKIEVDTTASPVVTEIVAPAPASSEEGKFNKPHGISKDNNGAIFVADENNNRVAVITPNGNVITFAGSSDGTAGDTSGDPKKAKLNSPRGIAVDSEGSVLVCDYANGKVKKVKQ